MAKGNFTEEAIIKSISSDNLGSMDFLLGFFDLILFSNEHLKETLKSSDWLVHARLCIINDVFNRLKSDYYSNDEIQIDISIDTYKHLVKELFNKKNPKFKFDNENECFFFILSSLCLIKNIKNSILKLVLSINNDQMNIDDFIGKVFEDKSICLIFDHYKEIFSLFNYEYSFQEFIKELIVSLVDISKKYSKSFCLQSLVDIIDRFQGYNVALISNPLTTIINSKFEEIIQNHLSEFFITYSSSLIRINMRLGSGRTFLLRILETLITFINNDFPHEKFVLSSDCYKIEKCLLEIKEKAFNRRNKRLDIFLRVLEKEAYRGEVKKFFEKYFKHFEKDIYIPIILDVSRQNMHSLTFNVAIEVVKFLKKYEIITNEICDNCIKALTFYNQVELNANGSQTPTTAIFNDISHILHKNIEIENLRIIILVNELEHFNKQDKRKLRNFLENIVLYGYHIFIVTFADDEKNSKRNNSFDFVNYFNYLQMDLSNKNQKYEFDASIWRGSPDISKIYDVYYNLGLQKDNINKPIIIKDEIDEFYLDAINSKEIVSELYNIIKSHQNSSIFIGYNIALLGNYGSGKTTIINILIKMLKKQQSLNGNDFLNGLIVKIEMNDYSSKSIVEEIYQQVEREIINSILRNNGITYENSTVEKYNKNYNKNKKKLNKKINKIIYPIQSNVDIESSVKKQKQHKIYFYILIIISAITLTISCIMTILFPLHKASIISLPFIPKNIDKDYGFNYASLISSIIALISSYFLYSVFKEHESDELLNNKVSIQHLEALVEFGKEKLFLHKFNKNIKNIRMNTIIVLDDLDRLSNEKIKNTLQGINFIKSELKTNAIIFIVPLSYEKFYENESFLMDSYSISNGKTPTAQYNFKNHDIDYSISIENKYINKIFDYKVFMPKVTKKKTIEFIKKILDKPIKNGFFGDVLQKNDILQSISSYFNYLEIKNLRDCVSILNSCFRYWFILNYSGLYSAREDLILALIILINMCHLRHQYVEFSEQLISSTKFAKIITENYKNNFEKICNNILLEENMFLNYKITKNLSQSELINFLSSSIKFYSLKFKLNNNFKKIFFQMNELVETRSITQDDTLLHVSAEVDSLKFNKKSLSKSHISKYFKQKIYKK